LEQEQQNISASVEHAACFGRPSTEALQMREISWDMKITSYICVTLAIRKGIIFTHFALNLTYSCK
jgi:hypothetical protein